MNQKHHLNCFLFFMGLSIGVIGTLFIINKLSPKRTRNIVEIAPLQKEVERNKTPNTSCTDKSYLTQLNASSLNQMKATNAVVIMDKYLISYT